MFQITATNEVGESERSVASTVIAGTVPGEVTDLVTVHADVQYITFEWTAPADDGGSPITNYQIFWDNASGSGLTLLKAQTGTDTQWSTTGTVTASALLDGSLYRFSVVAQNAVGAGQTSNIIEIYAASVPAAPEAPTLVS